MHLVIIPMNTVFQYCILWWLRICFDHIAYLVSVWIILLSRLKAHQLWRLNRVPACLTLRWYTWLLPNANITHLRLLADIPGISNTLRPPSYNAPFTASSTIFKEVVWINLILSHRGQDRALLRSSWICVKMAWVPRHLNSEIVSLCSCTDLGQTGPLVLKPVFKMSSHPHTTAPVTGGDRPVWGSYYGIFHCLRAKSPVTPRWW